MPYYYILEYSSIAPAPTGGLHSREKTYLFSRVAVQTVDVLVHTADEQVFLLPHGDRGEDRLAQRALPYPLTVVRLQSDHVSAQRCYVQTLIVGG